MDGITAIVWAIAIVYKTHTFVLIIPKQDIVAAGSMCYNTVLLISAYINEKE